MVEDIADEGNDADDGDNGEDENESDDGENGEEGNEADNGHDHEIHDHEDPINNADSEPAGNRDTEVEADKDHPLGDYSKALFEHAHDFVNDLAESSPEARDLKEQFDEAEQARDLYESWTKATRSDDYSLLGDQSQGPERGALVENYMKIEFLGMYLGLRSTSTTAGSHNPGSAHYQNGAVDFNVKGESMARVEQAMWAMRHAGVFVRDERGRPLMASGRAQGAWSNPHIHGQSVPIDPRRNGPLDRWSNPPFQEGTFMQFNRPKETSTPPTTSPGRRLR